MIYSAIDAVGSDVLPIAIVSGLAVCLIAAIFIQDFIRSRSGRKGK